MRFICNDDHVGYWCPSCNGTEELAIMETESAAVIWCACGTVFVVDGGRIRELYSFRERKVIE